MNSTIPKRILPVIVLSQFAGTSLWFVGNAVLPELQSALQLNRFALGQITASVQIGFIAGTLVFAFFSLADRYSPAKLFFTSSLLGALFNVMIAWLPANASMVFALRFLTGFFLAGIYPVGMKIAADWHEKGLGKALGYLIGALVMGTAIPHLLRHKQFELPWQVVLYATSMFAVLGGVMMISLVGDGPYRKKTGSFKWNAFAVIFSKPQWRAAAFGYFGHMWELYTFWGFVPVMLSLYTRNEDAGLNIPLLSFLVIASGAVGCIAGGHLSLRKGSARVALVSLLVSGICCVLSPIVFSAAPAIFLGLLFLWGITVVSDSPQFSTLVAQHAPEQLRGTALTIYNSIGFTISALSLVFVDWLYQQEYLGHENTFVVLGLGAIMGIPAMIRLVNKSSVTKNQKTND